LYGQEDIRVSTSKLGEAFYRRIWNQGELAAASQLLAEDFAFRGPLGSKTRDAFLNKVYQ
jgi:hypothetical protein